jgi:serine/threonine-protein kinase
VSENKRIIADRYELGELIGRGGMAEVHSGIDTRLGRTVAIKLLKADLAADSSFEIRFRQEAQASARMAHPTIVRVYDAGDEVTVDEYGTERHLPYIIMELVTGDVLRDILRQRRLTQQEAIFYATGILTALEFSHAAGVIHRDIKPANVMITQSNAVKVMDFGIARAVSDSSATLAHTNGIVGTAQYFSPEQAKGETVDSRTDLYSTGVLLYEMLTGKPPFTGETAVSVAYQHVSENAPAPSSINSAISEAIDSVVMKALAKDKNARFQNASEFRTALTAAVGGRSVEAFDDSAQPPTAEMQTVVDTPEAKTIPESDPFTELLASTNDQATNPVTKVQPTGEAAPTQIMESGFSLLGFETSGDTELEQTQVLTKSKSDQPPGGWLWGVGSGVSVLVIGLVIWLIAGGASLISFGGNVGNKIVVSDVVGKTYEEAVTTLTELDLLVSRKLEVSTTVPAGVVISTDPPAGQEVGIKTTINVVVSLGQSLTLMPNLAGMTDEDAILAITNAKLVLGIITQSDSPTIAKNLVISSDPAANEQIAAGTVVNLVLSTGSVVVPNIVNLEISEAKSQLTAPAISYTVETQVDPTCTGKAGTAVIAQSIPPGIQPQKQTIMLTLECIPKAGSVVVPNVVGLEIGEAESLLTAPAIGYSVEAQVDPTCAGVAGTAVIAQSIPAGLQPQKQTIMLTLECLVN